MLLSLCYASAATVAITAEAAVDKVQTLQADWRPRAWHGWPQYSALPGLLSSGPPCPLQKSYLSVAVMARQRTVPSWTVHADQKQLRLWYQQRHHDGVLCTHGCWLAASMQ